MGGDFHLTYDDVMESLAFVFRQNDKFCMRDVQYDVEPLTDNGASDTFFLHQISPFPSDRLYIQIGAGSLMRNMSASGAVRDVDAVRVVAQGFHENVHLWQNFVGFRKSFKSASSDIKMMARDMVINQHFSEYHCYGQSIDTSELYADKHSVIQTKKFFQYMSKAVYY